MRRIVPGIVAVIAVLLAGGSARGAEIALRASVRAPADRALVLADIADLTGAEAEAVGDLEVHPAMAPGKRSQIRVKDVRDALDERKVNWGRLTLRGAACEVVAPTAAAPARSEPGPPESPASRHEIIEVDGRATVRSAAAGMLAGMFGVGLTDLQIAFDDPGDALLRTSGEGRRIEVQPAASASGSRIPLNIWVYEGDRVVASGQVRADVQVRRSAVIVTGVMRRGQVISAGDVSAEWMWIEPTAGTPITSLEEAVGLVCRTRIPAGTALRADHVERAMLVRRGDLVTVHCIAGGVVVKAPARAQTDGRDGEVIEFKMDKSKRPFLARVSGAGRAVMISGPGGGEREGAQ